MDTLRQYSAANDRTTSMTRTATCTIVLAIGVLSAADIIRAGPASAPQETREAPRFRVSVEAVRIDAVVTDRNGRIVTDLTADDFEVRQDGKRQKVTFAQFVPVLSAAAAPPPGDPRAVPRAETLAVPPPPVRREDIQRTLAVVVDDLGLSAEGLQNTRQALHTFVDRGIRPTDLVALVRTGGSIAALQTFTTDRRVLHAAIDGLHWNGASRNGVEAFEPVNLSDISDSRAGLSDPNDFTPVDRLRRSMSTAGTLGALSLIVRGARDLPGRKAIIFVSEGFQVLVPDEGLRREQGLKTPDSRVRYALDRVIDQATRAGVVIYSLDCRGLQAAGLQASDYFHKTNEAFPKVDGPGSMPALVREAAKGRLEFNRDTQEGMAYLAEQTGGFAVLNTNDLPGGLGRITDDVRDYYVIGYTPEEGTFALPGRKPRDHKISISVRRAGLHVKTRKGFLGVSDLHEAAGPDTPAQQLIHAGTSPFASTDIALRATTLPGYSPEQGAFVRTLVHIDARALTFVGTEGGKKTASADVLGMVFDQEGTEVAHLSTGFSVALANDAVDESLRDGLAYTLRIPIRRAGAYQVRFAIRDQHSGALGSAGEFVEVGDMAGGAFALSGIVLRSDDGKAPTASSGPDAIALTPAQALRVYSPDTGLTYAYEIYNATTAVQATTSLWRGTERVFAAAPDTLVPPPGGDRRFAAAGGVKLGEGLPPGSYVLQVAATTADPKRQGKNRTAVQRIGFDVRR
jgi:VWFA-related protein